MTLSAAEAAHAWDLFKTSPLWARWPEYQAELAHRLSAWSCRAGDIIYRPSDPADRLYLVGRGTIVQTLERDGQTWFRQELGPGAFFGQQSLYSDRQQAQAAALTEATVYVMTAADLRVALEKNPDLHESLLRERLCGRLRSLPLFESLDEADLRWLAWLVAEEEVATGQAVPLGERPGLWIVDWGQVAVTGPASLGRPDWRLTAGNFLLSPLARISSRCVADTATATLETHCLYLAQPHCERLAAAFPPVAHRARHPLDLPRVLNRVPQLLHGSENAEARILHLAQFCSWAFVPAGQNITAQGAIGHSFILLLKGAAVVSAVDDQGRLRPRNLLRPGEYFGFTSLCEGRPRDATVRAVAGPADTGRDEPDGAEILILDRRDLLHAFAERPDLWQRDVWLFDRSIQLPEEGPSFDWLEEGEAVVRSDRRHWLWLAAPLSSVLLGYLLLVLFLLVGGATASWAQSLETVLLIAGTLVMLFMAGWITANYFDDYYVVTNRRITRRDRELLFWEARTDAPLEMVQDVTVDTTLLGRIFNYGDAVVRTAAKVGAIRFDHVPDADLVRADILRGKAEAVAAARSQNKENLRQGLMRNLRLALPGPDHDQLRALGENVPPPHQPGAWHGLRRWLRRGRGPRPARLPGARRGQPAWFRHAVRPLPERVQKILLGPPPPPQTLSGQVLWHKHWVNLVQRAGLPLLLMIALLAALVALLAGPGELFGFHLSALLLAWLVLAVFVGGWLWWQAADYWNDVYVVTDDRIIDIERRPLGLSAQRREGTLDRVQTVFAEQKGFWANVLNYGDVVIQTAAADTGFTFQMVGAPKQVQRVIFQKLDNYRRRQDARAVAERQRALIEGIEVYHELREERNAARRRENDG